MDCAQRRGDRGSMSVYAAALAPALFLCVMLFVNGAAKWNAWRDASDAANAAARAATQPVPGDYAGGSVQLGSSARSRAQQVLNASGYSGSVSISGDTVLVTVVSEVDYVFPLATLGRTVSGTGSSDLSVTGDG